MKNYFNSNLKFLRVTSGYKQEDLGKLLSKNYSTIGKWENGTRSPVMEDVLKICEIFNVELNDLLLKDLRFNSTNSTQQENSNNYKAVLKEKGLMDQNDYIDEKNLNKLLKIADMIQDINKKED